MVKNDRVHVLYTGNVQGVGFRFSVERIALRLGLNGYVKNMPDGRVEVISEGVRSVLETFLSDINENMSGYISDSQVEWECGNEEFVSFEVRF